MGRDARINKEKRDHQAWLRRTRWRRLLKGVVNSLAVFPTLLLTGFLEGWENDKWIWSVLIENRESANRPS